jgi:hypothetical protein
VPRGVSFSGGMPPNAMLPSFCQNVVEFFSFSVNKRALARISNLRNGCATVLGAADVGSIAISSVSSAMCHVQAPSSMVVNGSCRCMKSRTWFADACDSRFRNATFSQLLHMRSITTFGWQLNSNKQQDSLMNSSRLHHYLSPGCWKQKNPYLYVNHALWQIMLQLKSQCVASR